MARFEVVKKYKDSDIDLIPKRSTKYSAGYDMVAAEDTIVMPYNGNRAILMNEILPKAMEQNRDPEVIAIQHVVTLEEMAAMTKRTGAKPTLVSTGVKCYLEENQYLKLVSRSSLPLKHWLICANSEGIIDADYADNESNEGEIFFQVINLSPFPIIIKKGEKICQGIISTFDTVDFDYAEGARLGGFGSTSE